MGYLDRFGSVCGTLGDNGRSFAKCAEGRTVDLLHWAYCFSDQHDRRSSRCFGVLHGFGGISGHWAVLCLYAWGEFG